jgi:hypothetical protein
MTRTGKGCRRWVTETVWLGIVALMLWYPSWQIYQYQGWTAGDPELSLTLKT